MDLPKYVKDLKELLELMRRNDLAELEIEEEGHRVRLRKTEPTISPAPVAFAQPPATVDAAAAAPVAAGSDGPEAPVDDGLHVVQSPLAGTFYRAASPEADPFASDGDHVGEDQVLCIIEAMKVMNEIKAGVNGVLREVLVQNGEPVEFGQPLFKVELE